MVTLHLSAEKMSQIYRELRELLNKEDLAIKSSNYMELGWNAAYIDLRIESITASISPRITRGECITLALSDKEATRLFFNIVNARVSQKEAMLVNQSREVKRYFQMLKEHLQTLFESLPGKCLIGVKDL